MRERLTYCVNNGKVVESKECTRGEVEGSIVWWIDRFVPVGEHLVVLAEGRVLIIRQKDRSVVGTIGNVGKSKYERRSANMRVVDQELLKAEN
jgi:hypothetical protein